MITAWIVARVEAGIRPQTVAQNLAAIGWVYKQRGIVFPSNDPHVGMVLSGVKRVHGTAPVRKAALSVEQLTRMTASASPRDRAFMLLGFAGAFRRSELAELRVDDLAFGSDRLVVTLRASKGDRARKGVSVVIDRTGRDTCPVTAVERWLEGSRRTGSDSLFGVCADWIAQTVKRHAESVGLDPDVIGGHSLRAGLITEAVNRGVDSFTVSTYARHQDPRQTLAYVRNQDAAKIGNRIGL
jgi:integrase